MLNFEFDESDFKIRCFTNIKWINEKFKHGRLKFVAECKDSDIYIIDSNYEFKEEDSRCSIKIN